jgi:DNA-directed RNA polymerase specialized sigma subunit
MKELYEQWRKNPTDENMQKILEKARPIIYSEINKWSRGLSPELLLPKAEAQVIKAIKTYKPSSGTAITTHIVNYLQSLSRIPYTYQAVVRLPEYKLAKKFEFDRAQKELFMELGRDPTIDELAERLKWSRGAVVEMLKKTVRGESPESIDLPMFQYSSPIDVDYIYHGLDPIQQKVFQYSTGYMGSPQLSTKEIAKKLRLSEPQVYRIKNKIANIIKKYNC